MYSVDYWVGNAHKFIYGCMDINGNDLAKDRNYNELGPFNEGLAFYYQDYDKDHSTDRIGYIDKNFNIIIEDEALVSVETFAIRCKKMFLFTY